MSTYHDGILITGYEMSLDMEIYTALRNAMLVSTKNALFVIWRIRRVDRISGR